MPSPAGFRMRYRIRRMFMEQLGASCDLTVAAEAVGVAPDIIYALWKRSAGFRAECQLALDYGYHQLEMELLRNARFGSTADGSKPLTDASRIKLLFEHRKMRSAPGGSAAMEAIVATEKMSAKVITHKDRIETAPDVTQLETSYVPES